MAKDLLGQLVDTANHDSKKIVIKKMMEHGITAKLGSECELESGYELEFAALNGPTEDVSEILIHLIGNIRNRKHYNITLYNVTFIKSYPVMTITISYEVNTNG